MIEKDRKKTETDTQACFHYCYALVIAIERKESRVYRMIGPLKLEVTWY